MPFAIQPSPEYLAGVEESKNTTSVERILNSVMAGYSAFTQAREAKGKREQQQIDMYNSLRKAGYSASDAYNRSLKKSGFPMPGTSLEERKTEAEISEKEAAAEERRAKAKAYLAKANQPAGGVTANKKYEIETEKQNALSMIQGKEFSSRTMAERAVRKAYKNVRITDPEISAALDTTYPVSEGNKPKKSRGFLGQFFDGLFNKKEKPAAAAPSAARSGKLKSGVGYRVVQ